MKTHTQQQHYIYIIFIILKYYTTTVHNIVHWKRTERLRVPLLGANAYHTARAPSVVLLALVREARVAYQQNAYLRMIREYFMLLVFYILSPVILYYSFISVVSDFAIVCVELFLLLCYSSVNKQFVLRCLDLTYFLGLNPSTYVHLHHTIPHPP